MSDESRKVLVTGGAGFIGSHVVDAYCNRGDRVWVVDDLSSGRLENLRPDVEFVHSDIGDPGVRDLFRDIRFDVVNHIRQAVSAAIDHILNRDDDTS